MKSMMTNGSIAEIDQAVKDLNFAKFKRLGLLSKKIIDADQWLA